MAKNRKVKGFCNLCGDPVITGGKKFGTKWFHNPCYVAHSYGMPIPKGNKPRHSAPTHREVRERSEAGMNPIMMGVGKGHITPQQREANEYTDPSVITSNPGPEMEILAHANDVTLAMNPAGSGKDQRYFIWQGPRANSRNIVRFPNYVQANQYYRDVIDGKTGMAKNPSKFKVKPILIVGGIILAVVIAYWIYKKRSSVGNKIKDAALGAAVKMATSGKYSGTNDGFGGSP